jgi:hypothetical protein
VNRHARQERLEGVGPDGQRRIARARADVGLDGFAADVAARYLAGAGLASLCVRDAALGRGAAGIDARVRLEVDPALPAAAGDERVLLLEHPVARDLARGAMHALRVVRDALAAPHPHDGGKP